MGRRAAARRVEDDAQDWAAITRQARGGLSRPVFAKLMHASVASIEHWEFGRTVPYPRYRERLLAFAASPPTAPLSDVPVVTYATHTEFAAVGRLRLFTVFSGPRKQRVAEGVEFANGSVALCWTPAIPSTSAVGIGVYTDIQAVCALHGHDGPMEIVVRDL